MIKDHTLNELMIVSQLVFLPLFCSMIVNTNWAGERGRWEEAVLVRR